MPKSKALTPCSKFFRFIGKTLLFIGSLPYSMIDEELRALFERMGRVVYARVIIDKGTGKSRGFGFIEMSTAEEAERVLQKTIDLTVEGRKIVVKPAYESENFNKSNQ